MDLVLAVGVSPDFTTAGFAQESAHVAKPSKEWRRFCDGMQRLLNWIDARFPLTVVYFLFFLLMPWYTARDKARPVPARTT
jgi:hypothetical protein